MARKDDDDINLILDLDVDDFDVLVQIALTAKALATAGAHKVFQLVMHSLKKRTADLDRFQVMECQQTHPFVL